MAGWTQLISPFRSVFADTASISLGMEYVKWEKAAKAFGHDSVDSDRIMWVSKVPNRN